MKRFLPLAAMALPFAVAAPASAAITITASPGPVQPGENVLATSSTSAATMIGTTNQTSTLVSISSLNADVLTSTGSQGQARFEATDGSLDTANIFLTNGGTFTTAEFNLFSALTGTSSVQISVNGGAAQTFSIGNGQNFFGITATGGDTISSIAFNTNGAGVADLRQLRVSGITAAVPEPGTWALMLLGFGAIGTALRRRPRRSRPLLQVA